MRCAHCEAEFTPRRSSGKYCSDRCRAAAWQAQWKDALALVEEQLTRVLIRVRTLRGAKAAV
jgi:hypothetical protein